MAIKKPKRIVLKIAFKEIRIKFFTYKEYHGVKSKTSFFCLE